MKPARAFLQVVLSVFLVAALVVSSGFAATKKLDRHHTLSEEWNDSPLMSAILLSAGSGAPGDGSPSLSIGSPETGPPLVLGYPMSSPDNWNGGTGNWSVPGNWSAGAPGASSDVTIYSGHNDTVTLDTSPTINSLTLGGANNGTTSELTDGGVAQTLTISNGLAVGQTGYLQLTGGSTITVGTDLDNAGEVDIQNGSHLSITGNLNNQNSGGSPPYIYVFTGSVLSVTGNFDNYGSVETGAIGGGSQINVTGTLTNEAGAAVQIFGSGDSASVGKLVNNGFFYIDSGPTQATTAGSVTNSGTLDLENASALTVTGDVNNSGNIYTSFLGGSGGNTITINGMLTNSGTFQLNGPGDMATLGGLNNSGTVDVANGSTLQINGELDNSGTVMVLATGSTLQVGSVVNSGTLDLYAYPGTAMLTVTGDLTNSGFLYIENGVFANVGTLNNTGRVAVLPTSTLNLTNQPNGITDIVAGSDFEIGGTFTAGPNNAFYQLTSVEGTLDLYNQQTTSVTPTGGILTIAAGGSVTADSPYGGQTVLQINGDLTNRGTVDLERGSSVQILGNFDNTGTLITNTYDLGGMNTVAIPGMLTNSGTFQLNGPGDTATVGSVVNSGFIDLENGSALTVTGDVNNGGDLYTSDLGGSGHNTITIGGELTFSPGGQVKLFNPTDRLIISGGGSIELLNGAALSTPTLNNGGTINVDTLSSLLVGLGGLHGPSYNYTQLANGTLGEMITQTGYGVINLNGGSALLAGTLDIMLQAGFNPTAGTTYKFFTGVAPGELNGTFTSVLNIYFDAGAEYWQITYDNADGYVELTAEQAPVSEPATLLVLIPGLLGMGYGLRRRLLN